MNRALLDCSSRLAILARPTLPVSWSVTLRLAVCIGSGLHSLSCMRDHEPSTIGRGNRSREIHFPGIPRIPHHTEVFIHAIDPRSTRCQHVNMPTVTPWTWSDSLGCHYSYLLADDNTILDTYWSGHPAPAGTAGNANASQQPSGSKYVELAPRG